MGLVPVWELRSHMPHSASKKERKAPEVIILQSLTFNDFIIITWKVSF